jgi:hypothetical protein
VKAPPTRQELPAVATPHGPVRVEGIALLPSRRYVELLSQTASGILLAAIAVRPLAAS